MYIDSWNIHFSMFTGLHTQKAYTHTGISCARSQSTNLGHLALHIRQKDRWICMNSWQRVWCTHWLEEVPEWVYAFWECKPVCWLCQTYQSCLLTFIYLFLFFIYLFIFIFCTLQMPMQNSKVTAVTLVVPYQCNCHNHLNISLSKSAKTMHKTKKAPSKEVPNEEN